MKNKISPRYGTAPVQQHKLTLTVVITNGHPEHNTNLKFDVPVAGPGVAHVWLARLPKLRNAEAFPAEVGPDQWELRLDAVAETAPFEVLSFSPESARQWLLDVFSGDRRGATELLILAHHHRFTITITE